MDNRLIIGGVALAAVGGFFYLRSRQSTSNQSGGTIVDPNAPTSIAQQTVSVQGVTDQSGNLAPQFTWPYNQLALPYNFDQATGNLGNYQNPAIVGNQQTVTF